MTIEHANITDPQIHEPKGVSTAQVGHSYIANGAGSGSWNFPQLDAQVASLVGQVFVSNGSGGGFWKYPPQGWGNYKSTASQVIDTVASKLIINGLHATTNEAYLPKTIRGTGSLWNSTTNRITPVSVGDSYIVRLTMELTALTGTPDELTVDLDIGSDVTPSIVVASEYVNITGFSSFNLTVTFPIFCLDTFIANGAQIFMSVNSGSITLVNPAIFIDMNTDGSF